jgi:hypothetical protein
MAFGSFEARQIAKMRTRYGGRGVPRRCLDISTCNRNGDDLSRPRGDMKTLMRQSRIEADFFALR